MAAGTMEERLGTLETRLDSLQRQVEARLVPPPPQAKRGWETIVGTFTGDSLYDEAMRLGREWHEKQADETEAP